MLISIFLLIYDFANIEIAKVSLLGTELLVGRPEVLELAAWLIWAYLLVRYSQYLVAQDDSSVFAAFNNARRAFLQEAALEHFGEQSTAGVRIHPHFGRGRWGVRGWQAQLYKPNHGDYHDRTETHIEDWAVPLAEAGKISVKAMYKTSMHTTVVTDIVLPIALAVAVPMIHVVDLIQT